jgi:hypothetical protein
MQPLVYLVEGLFLVLFLATLRRFVLRRDRVSRDLALVFSALAGLFVVELWEQFVGTVPAAVNLFWAGLLLLQPVVTLHLVSLVRPVPQRALWLSLAATIATALPVLVVPNPGGVVVLLAVGAFVAIEAAAAIYLILEAIRREGRWRCGWVWRRSRPASSPRPSSRLPGPPSEPDRPNNRGSSVSGSSWSRASATSWRS